MYYSILFTNHNIAFGRGEKRKSSPREEEEEVFFSLSGRGGGGCFFFLREAKGGHALWERRETKCSLFTKPCERAAAQHKREMNPQPALFSPHPDTTHELSHELTRAYDTTSHYY